MFYYKPWVDGFSFVTVTVELVPGIFLLYIQKMCLFYLKGTIRRHNIRHIL